MQILSSDSGGLLKLWNVKSSECIKTLEAYDSDATVWALAVNSREDRVVTGASNSTLILWKDITEEEIKAEYEKRAEMILKEQELANLLMEKKYVKAIALAITLEQPFRVLTISKEILDGESGEVELKRALDELREDQTNSLIKFAVKWITNGRHSYAALFILQTIFQRYTPQTLDTLPEFRKSIEPLLIYTERHHERHRRMLERVQFVDYTVQCMRHIEHS
jgi:U3 small nucleolar RNA-associated protein 13